MPFKLTKTDVTALGDHVSALNTAHENLTGAITDYEEARSAAHAAYVEALSAAFTDLQTAMEPFTETVTAARDFVEGHVSDWQEDYDYRSAKWQNSPAGSAARALIHDWAEWVSNHQDPEILLPQEPEVPELEPIEIPANPADPLSDLPPDTGKVNR